MTDNQIKDNEIKLEDVEEFVWRWENHKKMLDMNNSDLNRILIKKL